MSRALYSAILLEQDSINEKARGRMWLYSEHNPHSGNHLAFKAHPRCVINEHLPNFIFWGHVGFDDLVGTSSCNFEVSETGWAVKKSARALPFIAICGVKVMSYWDNNMAQLVSLEFKYLGFIIKIHKGLTLEMTCMVWLTK